MSVSLQDHPARLDAEALLKACQAARGRRGGPGGQHRNKVETAVELVHRPTGIAGQAGERRSQQENHRVALFRLRINLALEYRQGIDLTTVPSELWAGRCRGGRIAVNPKHADFPSILAEALEVVAATGQDVKRAATCLGCTTSQLIKLLKLEPRALQQVNAAREAKGERALK